MRARGNFPFAGARAAVRASDSVAGTPRGYISASHVLTPSVSPPRCSFSVAAVSLLFLLPAVLLLGAVLFSCPGASYRPNCCIGSAAGLG